MTVDKEPAQETPDPVVVNMKYGGNLLEREHLHSVRIRLKDPKKLPTPDNFEVFLDGKPLSMVQRVSFDVDQSLPISVVKLEIFADITFEEGGPDERQ